MGIDFLAENKKGETPLSEDEKAGLKPFATTQGELDQFETLNITQGRAWLNKSKPKDPWSTDFALSLHKKLFGQVWNWAGKARKSEKNIGIPYVGIYKALSEFFLDIEIWVEKESYPTNEIIARFHHKTVQIHPFPNGNGRWSRIYTEYFSLKIYKLSPTWGKSIDKETRRNIYLEALKEADGGNFEPIIEFMFS